MRTSIRQELIQHVIDTIEDQQLESFDELHFNAFNEDYYIVYHSRAIEWLRKHGVDAFEAIGDVIEWEQGTFGEVRVTSDKITPEHIVNMYVYIKGEELLSEFDLDQDQAGLLADLRKQLTLARAFHLE